MRDCMDVITTIARAQVPNIRTREQNSAIAEMMRRYEQARQAARVALIEENVIGNALVKARQATGAELADIIIQCGDCDHWFVKVPSADDDRYAHCPRCGEPHEMNPVAGGDAAPHEDVSA